MVFPSHIAAKKRVPGGFQHSIQQLRHQQVIQCLLHECHECGPLPQSPHLEMGPPIIPNPKIPNEARKWHVEQRIFILLSQSFLCLLCSLRFLLATCTAQCRSLTLSSSNSQKVKGPNRHRKHAKSLKKSHKSILKIESDALTAQGKLCVSAVNRISKSRSTDSTGDGDPGDEGSTGRTS